MKLCNKCGAYNSDERRSCVDCGATLGEKLSVAEEAEIRKTTGEKIEKLYNRKDPLYVSLYDKIFGLFAVIGAVAFAVLMIINYVNNRADELLLMGFFIMLLGAFEAFVPKFSWALEKLRLGFSIDNADDAEPGVFYFYGRKMFITFTVVFGIILLIVKLFK